MSLADNRRRLAYDPPVSEKQRRAMYAAAEGRSTLGIPKKVGEEFVGKAHDAENPIAAGIVFVAPDGSVLLLHRSPLEKNFAGHFGIPGGGANDGETPERAAAREAKEEIGIEPDMGKARLLSAKRTPTGLDYYTYAYPTDDKFSPVLNDEHTGFTWARPDQLPEPMHPAVKELLSDNLGVAADMTPENWEELRTNFTKWTREEESESEHAEDATEGEQTDKFVWSPGQLEILQVGDGSISVEDLESIPDEPMEEVSPDEVPKVTRTIHLYENDL